MSRVQIISTGDGSHSLLNTDLNETYHSVHGALQESLHVFIRHGFEFYCERSVQTPVRILEVGFGTGLNVWLTAIQQKKIARSVHYVSLETFPLPEDVWQNLNYASSTDEKNLFEQIHRLPWEEDALLYPGFFLRKVQTSLQEIDFDGTTFDLIYFDAFAPNKQPELWDIGMLSKVTDRLSHNGVLVTYCAKGQVKRDLKSLGLTIETLSGPPGKKEMTRALKI